MGSQNVQETRSQDTQNPGLVLCELRQIIGKMRFPDPLRSICESILLTGRAYANCTGFQR